MKFKITRTSDRLEPKKPCAEAKRGTYPNWYVEFEDLPALIKFIKRRGECIVTEDSIEIYDDYRE